VARPGYLYALAAVRELTTGAAVLAEVAAGGVTVCVITCVSGVVYVAPP